jgi:hypothetical protein
VAKASPVVLTSAFVINHLTPVSNGLLWILKRNALHFFGRETVGRGYGNGHDRSI